MPNTLTKLKANQWHQILDHQNTNTSFPLGVHHKDINSEYIKNDNYTSCIHE